MRSVFFPLLIGLVAASPLTAQYSQFGPGCNGGLTATCAALNASATHVPYATSGTGLVNEYCHAVINPVANGTVTVIGFRIKTDSVLGTPVTVGTATYRDAAGPGVTTHTTPGLAPEGLGTITVDGPAGWYTTYCYPAIIVGPGEAFWISADTNGINPPDARLGSTTAPAPSFWRRPPFGTTAWAQTGIVQDPIYEVLCHGSTEIPVLSVDAPPAIGTTMNIEISNAEATSPGAFLAWGLSDSSWNGLTLPLDMALFGIPGCSLLTSAESAQFLLLTNGAASAPFAIPNQPTLVGVTFFNQFAEIRPTVPAGVVMSNAGKATVL